MSKSQGVLWENGGFRVTAVGLGIKGTPSLSDWLQAFRSIAGGGKSGISWAIGDLLVYADERKFEDEAVENVMDATGQKRSTLMNHKRLSKRFPIGTPSRAHVPWSYHALVSGLTDEEAGSLLTRAVDQSLGYVEVQAHARAARADRRRVEQDFPRGTYGLILAEPPWPTSGREDALEPDKVAALAPRVQAVSAPAAVLYLRTVPGYLAHAVSIVSAWGFKLRTNHAVTFPETQRESAFARERHDLLLVGTRGHPAEPAEKPDSVLIECEIVAALERGYPDVPRVRLYGEAPEGWDAWRHVEEQEELPLRGITIRDSEAVPA